MSAATHDTLAAAEVIFDTGSRGAIGIFLEFLVPFEIAGLRANGGPDDLAHESAAGCAQRLAEHGDVLLYGGTPNEATALLVDLAFAIAVLAFQPGGIRIFGSHWQADNA